MEKGNMYPDVPVYHKMPDGPPNYNQSHPTAPPAVEVGMMPMPSSDQVTMAMQPQQIQQQPQNMMIQCPPIPPLGPRPCLVTCPSCHHQLISNTCVESASKTHLFAALLCLVGLCCCACVPYCMDSCKNVNHYCSHCNAYLGVYNK